MQQLLILLSHNYPTQTGTTSVCYITYITPLESHVCMKSVHTTSPITGSVNQEDETVYWFMYKS